MAALARHAPSSSHEALAIMWLLRGGGGIDAQAFYLHEGSFVIGRAAPEIAIALAVRCCRRLQPWSSRGILTKNSV